MPTGLFQSCFLFFIEFKSFKKGWKLMAYPSIEQVLALKNEYTLIPVAETIWSDNLTPIRIFQHIRQPYSFLLESVEGGAMWARYSFIGHNPFLLFRSHRGKGIVEYFEGNPNHRSSHRPVRSEELNGSPLDGLKQLLQRYKSPAGLNLPRFSGGAVGYIGYDAVPLLADVSPHRQKVLEQDEIRLMFCDEIIAFDHLRQEITFIGHLHLRPEMEPAEVRKAYEEKVKHLRQKIEALSYGFHQGTAQTFRLPDELPQVNWDQVTSNFSKPAFIKAVDTIKEHIKSGEILQAVLSQRFTVTTKVSPFDIYRTLRMVNPSPYLYYLDLGDGSQIVGSSPERLVQVEHGKITVNPIAGTRKRGRTKEEDRKLAENLLSDAKELAEHDMLLELGQKDVSRVAQEGSITVPKRMEIQYFSHVMHLVSTIEGQVRADCDLIDCLASCFPAGTVSGAPKERAMQILAELEHECRHAYSGAIGYLSFSGNMDTCIGIRTIFMRENIAHIQAGAGIVADSVPELEWKETRNKASALLVAIQLAELMFHGEENKIHA